MRWPSSIAWAAFTAAAAHRACAYIPAIASNATPGSELDVHDDSTVSITWFPNGGYSTVISYQQVGAESEGISKGALIRVEEEEFVNGTWGTDTPWIALIGCDRNSTPVDLDEDIFTKVRDRGAKAALLYSNTSDGCLINKEYLGEGFSQIFDIFTAKKSTTAILIQSQFNNVNYSYTVYNSSLLNSSYEAVKEALARTNDNRSRYLVATLRSADAQGQEDPGDSSAIPTIVPTATPRASDPSQSLAMIILYVIVSLVSTLFLIVIISGAIRAFRHPERYGPRLYDPTVDGDDAQAQTRAAGITRAILDTFPVVKFGRQNEANANTADGTPMREPRYELKGWNVETGNPSPSTRNLLNSDPQSRSVSDRSPQVNPQERSSTDTSGKRISAGSQRLSVSAVPVAIGVPVGSAGANTTTTAPSRTSADPEPVDPAAIGRETCPICIVDFEEGDDLRVLPCEGKHRFHKDCVDPWLLELSSSCPICREDFQALENMAAANTEHGHTEEEEDRHDANERNEASGTTTSRFSRYIRFAQKRQRSQRDQNTSAARTTPYTDY